MSFRGQRSRCTDFDPPGGHKAVDSETDGGGLQTVIDVHRRWATEKNERMRIILEVTHTDDCGLSAVYQQKKGYGEVCKMNPSGRGQWKRVSHCATWLRVCVVFVCEDASSVRAGRSGYEISDMWSQGTLGKTGKGEQADGR